MQRSPSSNLIPVLQALFVTFLWSTSWVLIKVGLKEIPAISFAGLRYTLERNPTIGPGGWTPFTTQTGPATFTDTNTAGQPKLDLLRGYGMALDTVDRHAQSQELRLQFVQGLHVL